ncbi:MAG: extracellular solute-binding protein [Treponema sp.]|jgi:putative aldouronate transport system substrate-binding protein|nr:extracellular solute-binding protein [Treponema sp.]
MKNAKHRILFFAKVFIALLVCLTAITGCQKKGGPGHSGDVDYGATTEGPNYWWVKFEEPVTIHIVNMERPATPFLPGDSVTKNEWTRGFKEQLNVEVLTDWVSSNDSGYIEKLNLAIASNTLPDVFAAHPAQFRQLVEAGMTADLTDFIENNASDMVKNIMASAPTVTETAKVNGRLMGLPRYGFGDLWNVFCLWLRHDWMENTGLGEPNSFEDIEKVMDAFMRAHPGSYGFGLRKNLDEFFWTASAFGALPRIWIEGPDGSLVYGSVQPEMKAALEKFADWYKRGYLRKDFTSLDDRDIVNDIASGKLGLHIWANWAGWLYVDALKVLGINSYMEPYAIPSGNGKPHIVPVPIDNVLYIVVNKNFKNVPAVLKCISYHTWICMEATVQGALTEEQVYRYLLGGEGRHDLEALSLNDPYGNGPALVEWAHKVSMNNYQITEEPMTSEWLAHYEQAAPWWRSKNTGGYGRWIQQYAPRASAWVNLQVIKEGRYYTNRMTGALPEDVSVYGSTLDDLLIEGFTKIIVGDRPLSYFDTLIAEWHSSGGNIVTRAVNREYGKKK